MMNPLISIILLVVAVVSPITIFILKLQDLPRGVFHIRRAFMTALALGLCSWYFSMWAVFTLPFWAEWFEIPDVWNQIWLFLWPGALLSTIFLIRSPTEKRRIVSDLFILVLAIDFVIRLTPWTTYHGP